MTQAKEYIKTATKKLKIKFEHCNTTKKKK